jgi:hypothetical protein
MTSNRHRHTLVALLLLCAALGLPGLAQTATPEYIRAVSTIYAAGATAKLVKEWCDERFPALKIQNDQVLETWRTRMDLPSIEAKVSQLIGNGKTRIDTAIEGKRAELYAQLEQSSTDPESDCTDLEKALNSDFNLKVLYPNEYALIAAQAPSPSVKPNTPSTASPNTPTTNSPSVVPGKTPNPTTITLAPSKLEPLPAFDYVAFAKTKLDPEKEPIPDEYHCYPEVRGEKYGASSLTLQILVGRKYRVGVGNSISSGTFRMDGYDLYFTSGVLASKRDHFYTFKRYEGAQIWLYDLGNEDKSLDFRCFQRGGNEQLEQLRFKRKDPQPGTYPCFKVDGSGQSAGTLEVLSQRRYRYAGSEGSYKVNITGDLSNDYSSLDFMQGGLDDQTGYYEEDESGRQEFSFGRNPKIECVRQITARPNPKFGQAKAPAAPGVGGLEGRYFYGINQVALNGYLACGGICYQYLLFQKNGYVYSDDLEDTEGLMDTDCTRTYPSGFPVCEVYSVKGNTIQIGLEKPVSWKRGKTGLIIDGDQYDILEPLDGLKLNAAYESLVVQGTAIGTGGSSSSVDLMLRKDGRFSREANSSFFFGATDTGTSSGSVTASVAGSNSRSNTGSYKLYGNTIEFKYDDERVIKQFIFLPSGRKDPSFMQIAGRKYWVKDKK